MMKQLLTLPNLRRLLSLALCVLMLTGLVPQAQAAAFVRREADASTLNDWEAYFGDDVHTSAYAGSVWTDKSVYADAAALNADLELKNGSAQVAVSDPDHFLVALSAISSSKSITAHSTIPVDVVFVLDMSGSMGQKRYDANDTVDQETTARIEYMIEPLNSAITTLMELNAENIWAPAGGEPVIVKVKDGAY